MKMKTLSIAVAVLTMLFAGCATKQYLWYNSASNQAQFDTDKAQCQYSAATATASYSPNNRGYRTSIGQAMADQYDVRSRQNEIFGLCMQARGYVWRAVN